MDAAARSAPTVADLAHALASTRWGAAARTRALDAHALARPMARALWLRYCSRPGMVVRRPEVAYELGYGAHGSARVGRLERRALRLLCPTDPLPFARSTAPYLYDALLHARRDWRTEPNPAIALGLQRARY